MITENDIKNSEQIVKNLMEVLGFSAQINVEKEEIEEGEIIKMAIDGEGLSELIGHKGKNLYSLQHLVSIAVNKDKEEKIRVIVDVNSYKQKREEYVESLAKRALDEVNATGQSIALPPMKPFERRIVHMVLKEVEGIETESEGQEGDRYVIIKPKSK